MKTTIKQLRAEILELYDRTAERAEEAETRAWEAESECRLLRRALVEAVRHAAKHATCGGKCKYWNEECDRVHCSIPIAEAYGLPWLPEEFGFTL